MDWIAAKTGALLNSSAAVLDQVVQTGTRLETTLSPSAMKVVKGGNASRSWSWIYLDSGCLIKVLISETDSIPFVLQKK